MGLISVIVPCYNQAIYLSDALNSLMDQTCREWECIIVNDGSPDNTEDIAAFWLRRDNRYRYVRKPNEGLSSARNAGLDLAKGDWVQFLDADDILLPEKFEKQLEVAAGKSRTTLTYCNYFLGTCDEPRRRVEPWSPSLEFHMSRPLIDIAMRWESELSIPIHAPLFPAWLFRDKQLRFDVSLPNHEDWDMWMQVFALMDTVLFVRDELAIYRVCPDSMCADRSRMWLGFSAAIDKQKRHFSHDPEVIRGLRYLAAMNNYSHRRGLRGRLRHLGDHGVLPEWLWPIRGLARRVITPPPKPFGLRGNAS